MLTLILMAEETECHLCPGGKDHWVRSQETWALSQLFQVAWVSYRASPDIPKLSKTETCSQRKNPGQPQGLGWSSGMCWERHGGHGPCRERPAFSFTGAQNESSFPSPVSRHPLCFPSLFRAATWPWPRLDFCFVRLTPGFLLGGEHHCE